MLVLNWKLLSPSMFYAFFSCKEQHYQCFNATINTHIITNKVVTLQEYFVFLGCNLLWLAMKSSLTIIDGSPKYIDIMEKLNLALIRPWVVSCMKTFFKLIILWISLSLNAKMSYFRSINCKTSRTCIKKMDMNPYGYWISCLDKSMNKWLF